MRGLVLLVFVIFLACAPRSRSRDVVFYESDPRVLEPMLALFQTEFQKRKIRLGQPTKAFQHQGVDEAALRSAVAMFYSKHPGMCPLRENAFLFLEDQQVFGTIAAKDDRVAVLVYDRGQPTGFVFGWADGSSDTVIAAANCLNP